MKRGIKYDFSLLALLLIPVGVSISVVGYQMSTILKLPVFIDQIGTVMVSMIAGPWIGLLTGLLGNVVNGMLNPLSFAFSIVSMCVGFSSGYFSKWKMYTNPIGLVIACVFLAIISAMTAAIVTVFLFGGVTGAGTDFITAAFIATGDALWKSVISTNLISGTINTIINVGVGLVIVKRIPDRFLVKLNYGLPYIKRNRRKSNE